jgi:hypothetical protein
MVATVILLAVGQVVTPATAATALVVALRLPVVVAEVVEERIFTSAAVVLNTQT